ncbi:site-specific integrase [Carboxylicivirga sp. N1Y132]|uniref:Site-specific integrase n=2 Tax=Carboxylicivirga marina TaxID=2800988 RepID=A0ABS1HGK4_9BACT|nr:site-specific integrase [Carboxylicivirga marina]MBK3516721.1 site-specific integrase [Carboxylicivirga marina]
MILISHKGTNTELATKIAIDKKYWGNEQIKRNCPQVDNVRSTNRSLSVKVNEAWDYIEELEERRKIDHMTAKQIGEYIKKGGSAFNNNADFLEYFKNYLPKIENQGTRERYNATLTILEDYSKGSLLFSDINKPWLNRFKEHRIEQTSPGTANIDLRNIRALFNRAIDVDELIDQNLYPFRKFEFAKATPRNLRLPVEAIRLIRDFETKDQYTSLARDFFMLSFYLIGMNNIDIYEIAGINDGRIEYQRRKTSKAYNIKVELEAQAIIDKRKGVNTFLIYQERYANHKNLTKQMNKHLKTLAKNINEQLEKDGIKNITIPEELVMYHARHTWAGIAAKKPIGASKPLIAQSLGHGKTTVTDTYFDYDWELVDDLNRKVLDILKQ